MTKNLFNYNRQNINKYNFSFIDLFAGIGGIRLAFESVGGKCIFSSEWDEKAKETYKANFSDIPYGDITKIDEKSIPNFDILCAGFPCQPFSLAGLKKGFTDTRGTLFFDIMRIINYHKPKVVFLENVKNLKNHDKGRTFSVIIGSLEEIGYKVFYDVLNAKDFGLPQNRERIFIVAFLNKNVYFEFPEKVNSELKLGYLLEKKVDQKYTISDKLWEGHKRRKREHLLKGNGFGYSLFDENSKYTSTLSARYYKDGSEILINQKDSNPRKLTPREAARLQGFPDNFVIPVSDNSAYKQFGNSVAVNVIKSIAKEIILSLNQLEDSKKSVINE
ncbi:MAG TPA: DNA cytosine methyltransferase [Rickettsiales bacterium]|nr:DNA cytosine methyltransferase [Rickettsiales bacterium]